MDDYSFCRAYMSPDEIILWRGKPQKGHLFRKIDRWLLLLLAVALVCWTLEFLHPDIIRIPGDLHGFVHFFGIVSSILTVGWGMFRLILTPFSRRNFRYIITERRVLVKSWGDTKNMRLEDLYPFTLEEYSDGNGTITFGDFGVAPQEHWGVRWGVRKYRLVLPYAEIENIPNARYVYGLLQNLTQRRDTEMEEADEEEEIE